MDILSSVAILIALVGIVPVAIVSCRYRNEKVIPVGKRAFWSMGLGLLGIASFYIAGVPVLGIELAHILSKVLVIFIAISTAGLSVGVLVYNKTCHDVAETRGLEALDCG